MTRPQEWPRWITVGRVGRPHGLDGSFVVERASEEPERFRAGKTLDAEGELVRVEAVKRSGGRLVVRLDRPVPRGTDLRLEAQALPALPDGSFYVFELAGFEVVEQGGRLLGHVRDVAAGVANDVLELDTDIGLPLVEACVLAVDRVQGRILVAPGFANPG